MTWAWEKFHMAVHTLAGPGSIQARLADAYSLHLSHVGADELPEQAQPLFRRLRQSLTGSEGGQDLARVGVIVSEMSDDQAANHVEEILTVHDVLARREGSF